MKIVEDEQAGYSRLLYAIVARAVMDAAIVPSEEKKTSYLAFNAFEFLFGNDVDIYLDLIDINPERFKTQLVDAMFSDKTNIDETTKRVFRINYKAWQQKKNKALLKLAEYSKRPKCKS